MMMSSVASVKFIKTNVTFRYHTKGVSNQVSAYSDHEIKSYSCSNSSTKMRKNKKVENKTGLKNGAIRGLQIGTGFRDYRSGQEGLQIEAALGISNRGKKIGVEISNWGKDSKAGQRDFKSGQRLQIGARGTSNRGRDYKSIQSICRFRNFA